VKLFRRKKKSPSAQPLDLRFETKVIPKLEISNPSKVSLGIL
jgi:hypothetical protein